MIFHILLLIATLDFHLGFGINALLQYLCGFFPSSINEETLAKHAENAKGSGFAEQELTEGGHSCPPTTTVIGWEGAQPWPILQN